jgi:hypothetical protein
MITMTTYAAEIEEANDNAIRKARVDAMFSSTRMAASLGGREVEPSGATNRPVLVGLRP